MALKPLEKECIKAFRSGGGASPSDGRADDVSAWLRLALDLTLQAGRTVREVRIAPLQQSTSFKEDATPVTKYEVEIESMFRRALSSFCPDAVLVGEESGGQIPRRGMAVAIDPIDGTWALLNRMTTCATCTTVYRDGVPLLGVVMNPATAEVGYGMPGDTSRLLQLDLFGDDDQGVDLPLDRPSPESVLVNLHPSRSAGPVVDAMIAAWGDQRLRLVRMEGGAPAMALLEAAKGSFVYVNLWGRRRAEPFDLAAGVLLVRGAGGEVIDAAGEPIDPVAHAGPFIAGVQRVAVHAILALIGPVLTAG